MTGQKKEKLSKNRKTGVKVEVERDVTLLKDL